MARETVLIIGSSGNMGVSAIIGALRSNLDVLAPVRKESSKEKILHHLDFDKSLPKDRITFVTADISSDDGVAGIVEQVESGKLPGFQHVYSGVGEFMPQTPIHTVSLSEFRRVVRLGYEVAFLTYCATIPYLLAQKNPTTTWTLVTGSAGEDAHGGITGIGQGALFSFANIASQENEETNIRFNELYLKRRVEYDLDVDAEPYVGAEHGGQKKMRASEFARVYEKILADKSIKGARVAVLGFEDLDDVKWRKKLPQPYKF